MDHTKICLGVETYLTARHQFCHTRVEFLIAFFDIGGEDVLIILDGIKRDTILDLNTADTTEFMLLRGVGRFTAMQIIRYRQALGGYYSTSQLYEISEIAHDRIDSLLPHLYADTSLITPIDVNRASVKQLYSHPYISYKQAEQLYDLRRRKLRLHSPDELSAVFSPDERQRLLPYLRFDGK